jgi:hypothetical protein
MNKRIEKLATEVGISIEYLTNTKQLVLIEKFAELIVEECRNVVIEVYRKTPLELCGPLLTADEEIADHFYGVEE